MSSPFYWPHLKVATVVLVYPVWIDMPRFFVKHFKLTPFDISTTLSVSSQDFSGVAAIRSWDFVKAQNTSEPQTFGETDRIGESHPC